MIISPPNKQTTNHAAATWCITGVCTFDMIYPLVYLAMLAKCSNWLVEWADLDWTTRGQLNFLPIEIIWFNFWKWIRLHRDAQVPANHRCEELTKRCFYAVKRRFTLLKFMLVTHQPSHIERRNLLSFLHVFFIIFLHRHRIMRGYAKPIKPQYDVKEAWWKHHSNTP